VRGSERRTVPVALIWQQALRDSELGAGDVFLGLVLGTCLNRFGIAWPGRAALSAGSRCHIRTVERRVDRLERARWLTVDRSSGGRSVTNLYVVSLPDSAALGYHERWRETAAHTAGFADARDPKRRHSGRKTAAFHARNGGNRCRPKAFKAVELGDDSSQGSSPPEKNLPLDECARCHQVRPLVAPRHVRCAECQAEVDAGEPVAAKEGS
jgi:hypothetical protein